MALLTMLALATTLTTAFAGYGEPPLVFNGTLPSFAVPACPEKGTITYNWTVPTWQDDFPPTQVDMCYSGSAISIDFTAREEENFYFNESQSTNDAIFNYEAMETFIAFGDEVPKKYLEFEVSPNNVTFNAFIDNPTTVKVTDTTFIEKPIEEGLTASTKLDKEGKVWTSKAQIPLALFNVSAGGAKGTKWRMNFFRIVCKEGTCPNEKLGAWSPPDVASFHQSGFFGHVEFV